MFKSLEKVLEEKDETGSLKSFSSLNVDEGSQHDDISYYTDHKLQVLKRSNVLKRPYIDGLKNRIRTKPNQKV